MAKITDAQRSHYERSLSAKPDASGVVAWVMQDRDGYLWVQQWRSSEMQAQELAEWLNTRETAHWCKQNRPFTPAPLYAHPPR